MNVQSSYDTPVLRLVPPPEESASREALTVTHFDQGALWVVALAGEADISGRDDVVRALANALSMRRSVVAVDVSALTFCDSWCVDAVLEANSTAAGGTMVLLGGRGMVSRVFDLLDPEETLARHA